MSGDQVLSTPLSAISQQIWDMKYRLKQPDMTPVDKTLDDTWARVARAVAQSEKNPEEWTALFQKHLNDHLFLPAGRILAGAGADRRVTLFNCFVMSQIDDDMGGIFESLKEAAVTLQQGGGIGYDFSTIRPKGAAVAGVGADASGPVSFMEVWDAMCRTILSAGSRRGAMMGCLRCDHPDIETFIEAKRDARKLRNFNLSVLVTDDFIDAVKNEKLWSLTFGDKVYKTLPARDLWQQLMRATYEVAEPGVIFIDRINEANNLSYCENIHATNPCGEQPLPPYGACLLGSINLAQLVRDPYSERATLDLEKLKEVTAIAVRFLDNVIDVSNFPLPEQKQEALAKRRIGLGVTGLADALILCRCRYGSEQSLKMVESWLRCMRDQAYMTSIELAQERGPFPLCDREKLLKSPFIQRLPDVLKEGIARHGLRNGLLTSIAPTGTISLFANNVSSGIEPVFAYQYQRHVLQVDGRKTTEMVEDFAYRLFVEMFGQPEKLPHYFVEAAQLTPHEHLSMQALAQKYIDSSISKTVNLSSDISFSDFENVYLEAYQLGCKGCTTYRPNDVTGAVLIKTDPTKDRSFEKQATVSVVNPAPSGQDHSVVYMTQPLARPESLPGKTYKIQWPETDHAFYITLNDIWQDNRRRPFEIFINSKNMEHYAWTVALTRMISAVFRRGGDVAFVVEELKAVFDPRGGQWMKGRYVPSLLAAIGDVIEQHMREIGFLPQELPVFEPNGEVANGVVGDPSLLEGAERPAVGHPGFKRGCPRCGQRSLVRQSGCDNCLDCGFSRCG